MSAYIKTKQGNRKRTGSYFKCETCGEEFYVCPSFIRTHEKNDSKIRYCSMACYKKTGEDNPFHGKKHSKKSIKKMSEHPNRPKFKRGEDNPNFSKYGVESDYEGITHVWWRKKLMEEVGVCEICGFNDKRILVIHHKDVDRTNNCRENLILLCQNCHATVHYEEKNGMYHFLG